MYNKITDQAWNSIEKTCNTCQDSFICFAEGKDLNKPCEHWKPEFNLFCEMFEKAEQQRKK